MSGVKGRSGRKGYTVEMQRARIINKAWLRSEKNIDDLKNKFGDIVAKDIALKTIPQQVNTPDGPIVLIWGGDGADS